ncbi:uncharacterized protein LAJ45_07338 [Morchella importuna]|uniref:uncharacterized protein n=1 Tax=Morchella importuna TaxID=1174673 RepID=UPI001E8CBF2B|nr:uncharacterized protein LAJ45_07338 [Morchella importuna]KAH8148627.1 hypothetical protein LAJ45_07338 [Morchella importuna]
MANLSDEDSQMHDSPSSTPSTPPLSQPQPQPHTHTHTHTHTHNLVNPAEHLSLHSPPDSQGHPQTSSQGAQAGRWGRDLRRLRWGWGGWGRWCRAGRRSARWRTRRRRGRRWWMGSLRCVGSGMIMMRVICSRRTKTD